MPPQNVPLWHVDYLELKEIKTPADNCLNNLGMGPGPEIAFI